ncbi:UNVERIFIED_CONTAM: hypothetical protein Scaly_2036900 [Sesamum calycinum]|uniref:DUF4283 domain-containing protein n=2 Tax=Sesamum TaxID=4181 RepID=A0AAW2N3J8_9LAMI
MPYIDRGFLLVGRLLTPRPFQFDVIKMTDRALKGGPWIFDENLVILDYISPDENPLEVDLNWCKFHVHIHGLLLQMMTRVVAEFIGKRLGRSIESDINQAHFMMGDKVRVRVALDVRLPLKRELVLCWTKGQELQYRPWLREPRLVQSRLEQDRDWRGSSVERGGR